MHRVGHAKFRDVFRGAGYFQVAVDTIDGPADHCHGSLPQAETVCRARSTVRFSRTVLNPFIRAGLAPCPAWSAAAFSVQGSGDFPASAASTSGRRQGLVPTPPAATRAERRQRPTIIEPCDAAISEATTEADPGQLKQ